MEMEQFQLEHQKLLSSLRSLHTKTPHLSLPDEMDSGMLDLLAEMSIDLSPSANRSKSILTQSMSTTRESLFQSAQHYHSLCCALTDVQDTNKRWQLRYQCVQSAYLELRPINEKESSGSFPKYLFPFYGMVRRLLDHFDSHDKLHDIQSNPSMDNLNNPRTGNNSQASSHLSPSLEEELSFNSKHRTSLMSMQSILQNKIHSIIPVLDWMKIVHSDKDLKSLLESLEGTQTSYLNVIRSTAIEEYIASTCQAVEGPIEEESDVARGEQNMMAWALLKVYSPLLCTVTIT
jgi:hypothetical protein